MSDKLFTTKDWVMLGITLGGVIVSVTAWGFALKEGLAINSEKISQLTRAQEAANLSAVSLNGKVNEHEVELGTIGVRLDQLERRVGAVSYAPIKSNGQKVASSTTKNETTVKFEERKVPEEKKDSQEEEEKSAAEVVLNLFGL